MEAIELEEEIIRLYSLGCTVRFIYGRLKTNRKFVNECLKKYKVLDLMPDEERILKLRKKTIELYGTGLNYRQVSEELGISRASVYRYLNESIVTRSEEARLATNAKINARNKSIKEILVKEHGGKCIKCGYDTHIAGLDFHHIDPTTKKFPIGSNNKKLEDLREESKKCALLCANCHREVHAGLFVLEIKNNYEKT